jgi:hypothetical protein
MVSGRDLVVRDGGRAIRDAGGLLRRSGTTSDGVSVMGADSDRGRCLGGRGKIYPLQTFVVEFSGIVPAT